MRLGVGFPFESWWRTQAVPPKMDILLWWEGGIRLKVATLAPLGPCLKMELGWRHRQSPLGDSLPQVPRVLAQAFTRSGFMHPRMESEVLARLLQLAFASDSRIEFIFDTNALSQGIGHWLAEVFADRCDLVTTAVTLRELQDLGDRSALGSRFVDDPNEGKETERARAKLYARLEKSVLARQAYLAGRRFIEFSGYYRPRWRELDADDTALMLAQGEAHGEKSSLADTMLLRSVRRSIQRRVRGLERLFVTGDVGLARRAATELPEDSVVTARVPQLAPEQTLVPVRWFPGPDQGRALTWGQPTRLVWELLACGDAVELVADSGAGYRFSAWQQDEMGSTDFVRPWVRVEAIRGGWATPSRPGTAAGPTEVFLQPDWVADLTPFDDRLRVPASHLFAALSRLATATSLEADVDLNMPDLLGDGTTNRRRRRHLGKLLDGCGIGTINKDGSAISPGPRAQRLATAWAAGDRTTVFWLLSPWAPLRKASIGEGSEYGRATHQSARAVAAALGFVARINRELCVGGATPSLASVKSAFEDWRPDGTATTIRSLLIDFFLKELGVSPSRILAEWERLRLSPLFHGIAFRRGGHPDDGPGQRVLEFTDLSDGELPLDSVDGFRDFIPQEPE